MDLKVISYAFFRGFYDSLAGIRTILVMDKEVNERTLSRISPTRLNPIRRSGNSREGTPKQMKKFEESKVLRKVFECSLLNGFIFMLSILLFEYGLLPALSKLFSYIFGEDSFIGKMMWSWIEPLSIYIFKTVWVIPLFFLSKIVNALWFQNIADSAYRYSRGRPIYTQSISVLLADSIFSVVIQFLFLLQAMICSYIPIAFIGTALSLVQICMLYSLYAFEYKWFNMGWELHKRLDYIETNWPYFIGSGLPLAICTQYPESWIISGCIFSIFFPFFIISANEANPVTGVCNYHLHLFSPVIYLSNLLFSKTFGLSQNKNVPKPSTIERKR